ncbi:MAG: secondary thiamine-phosphate synthase enzyme YjbQ, partial [Deltaproteobacteria bacterium]|nr:secondary thiamine-phosphate synthase enzyme YjbQ [Deltaproteobacteria bacterium]
AAIAINENDDPNIGVDLLTALDRAIPDHAGWLHDRIDNNAQAHIKAAILGPSELIPIADGDLLLGTWQGLMLIELDGPRSTRRVAVSLIS